MSRTSFIKMHGLGNDFVILDRRLGHFSLTGEQVRQIAARSSGVGCDQLILLDTTDHADIHMRIYNADGGEVAACGNATRCVGALMLAESGREEVSIETAAGLLQARPAATGLIEVTLPPPGLAWRQIPLAQDQDTLHMPIIEGNLQDGCAVSVGNPHLVFFVDDCGAIPLETLGPKLEHHPLFPQRTNVEVVQPIAPDSLRMRVWERGAGITQACGTGACAALIAAVRRGMSEGIAKVEMPGGMLEIRWRPDQEEGRIRMIGDAVESFRGTIDLAAFLG